MEIKKEQNTVKDEALNNECRELNEKETEQVSGGKEKNVPDLNNHSGFIAYIEGTKK